MRMRSLAVSCSQLDPLTAISNFFNNHHLNYPDKYYAISRLPYAISRPTLARFSLLRLFTLVFGDFTLVVAFPVRYTRY
jgi:hypothetical protein